MKISAKILLALLLLACALLASCGKKECEHEYTEKVVAPTCVADGYTEHTCTKCGDVYKDVPTQKVTHPYKSVVVSPTCTAEGYTEHTCTVCGDSYKDTSVAKLPHTYKDEVVSPTCSAEGYTEHTCTVCGDSYKDETTAMTAHRFNGAPCTYCGMEEITENITPNTEWYSTDKLQFAITTAEELAGLAALVNAGTDFTNQVIYLEADVDLGYAEWIPIGNAENAFKGSFNGNGNTISSLKINAASSYVGLFGNVSGTILDFLVSDATVYVKDAYENVSVACGFSSSPITGVTVSGFLDAPKSVCVGGVVGKTKAQLTEVSSAVEIIGGEYVGGIAGKAEVVSAVFKNASNEGTVNGGAYTGGIVGYVTASNTVQTDLLSNTGKVKGAGQVGGIFGYANAKVGSIVYGANVSANIEGEYYVGGIVGRSDNVAVSHCSNDGSTVTATLYCTDGTSFYAYLGGYVGAGYSVDNCINNVDVNYTSRGAYVGGIAGYLINTATTCENHGDITGSDYIGGIVGMINTTSSLTVSNLKNFGNISGGYRLGGIIGSYSSTAATTLSKLENSGSVTSTSCRVAGIIGCHDNGTATVTAADLHNTGDIIGQTGETGGLFGYIMGSTSSLIKNSTSSASITGAFWVGGLCGYTATVTIRDCSNEGSTIIATSWHTDGGTDYVWLGGYAGQGYIITGCTNNSDINYEGTGVYVGGIVGYAINAVSDCTNNGSISSNSSYVGGIAGYLDTSTYYNLTYKNLVNSGNVSGKTNVGGIVGQLKQNVEYGNKTHNLDGSTTYYDVKTYFNNIKNSGNVVGNQNVGGILGNTALDNYFYYLDKACGSYHGGYNCCDVSDKRYGRSLLVATGLESTGEVSGESNVGEVFGYFQCDGDGGVKSTVTTYTVTGKITVNGEIKEGTYDIGSNTNLTLSGRVVYVPEVETPETETPEDGEVTENPAE